MLKVLSAKFLYSVPTVSGVKSHCPSVIIIGRSNVGKSSFINYLCQRKDLAKTAKKPGATKHAVIYEMEILKNQKNKNIFLIDLPGYGYANMPKKESIECEKLIFDMITSYEDAKIICMLFDIRRELESQEIEMIKNAQSRGIKVLFILTKADKINLSNRLPLAQKTIKALGLDPELTLIHSNLDGKIGQDNSDKILGLALI